MTQEEYTQMLADARDQFNKGTPLFGKNGAFHRVLEDFLNAAMEGEMDSHLEEGFTSSFKDPMCLEILRSYRKEVIELAKSFGCNSVIYCSDGTPSAKIRFDNMMLSSSDIIAYARSGAFLNPAEGENVDPKYKNAQIIDFYSFLKGRVHLTENEFCRNYY